jgi:hypothetical protein
MGGLDMPVAFCCANREKLARGPEVWHCTLEFLDLGSGVNAG